MEKFDEGLVKWAILGTCIGVLEFVGTETLTHAFQRAREHPVGKYVALGALAFTGAHLLDVLPHEIDPYYKVAHVVDKFKQM